MQVLQCGTGELGYRSFFCVDCGHVKRVHFSCKKRLCPSCGQWASRKFSIGFMEHMLPVTHRHLTLSIPADLWALVHKYQSMQKGLIRCAYRTVKETMELYCHTEMMPGATCVLHNFGRDLKKNCHVHMLVTEGGRRPDGQWVRFTYFPFVKRGRIHKTINEIWRDNVLDMIRLCLPRTNSNRLLIDGFYRRYPNGFYVHGPKESRIKTNNSAYNRAKYITRYVCHPPISNSRIMSYDGLNVSFWYEKPSTKERHIITLPVLEFLYRVIMHLPPKGFHMVVRYGLYSAKYLSTSKAQTVFTSDGKVIKPKLLSWREAMIQQNGSDPLKCNHCNKMMVLVCTVYKRRDKFKVKYHLSVSDMMAIKYPDAEAKLLRE